MTVGGIRRPLLAGEVLLLSVTVVNTGTVPLHNLRLSTSLHNYTLLAEVSTGTNEVSSTNHIYLMNVYFKHLNTQACIHVHVYIDV